MPAPIRTSLTATYNALAQEANARGENNDCSVKALALVAGASYAAAHAALAEAGRKPGRGVFESQISAALETLGLTAAPVDPEHFLRRYPGHHATLKNVTTHHPERFNAVWADGERYLLFTRGHVLAVVNGENHDHTKGRAVRVKKIWRIVLEKRIYFQKVLDFRAKLRHN